MSRAEPSAEDKLDPALDPTRVLDGWQLKQSADLPELDFQALHTQPRKLALPVERVDQLRRRGFSMRDVQDIECLPSLPEPQIRIEVVPVGEQALETPIDAPPKDCAGPAVDGVEVAAPDVALEAVAEEPPPQAPDSVSDAAKTAEEAAPEPLAEPVVVEEAKKPPAPEPSPLPEFAWPGVVMPEVQMPELNLSSVLARARQTADDAPKIELPRV